MPGTSPAYDRLYELADRFGLSRNSARKLGRLVDLVSSDPQAPTAIRNADAVVDDHVADSLVALELDVVQRTRTAVDLGSGAGFPGLALAVALPAAAFTLVESSGRKCAFLAHVIGECRISNADVVNARAESFAPGRSVYDLATARALAALEVTCEYAAPLLRVGGSLVAWRGKRDDEAEAVARRAAGQLGFRDADVHQVRPYPAATNRHLYVVTKVSDTPSQFPRRPGVAAKRPLGHEPASDRVRR